MNKSIVAATRLNTHSIAQARDGLINLGYPAAKLNSISSILRTTFLYGLNNLANFINLEDEPSKNSLNIITPPEKIIDRT